MKLFTTKQIAALDAFTIENEPISAIDLMERASLQITDWLTRRFTNEQNFVLFAGPGNNGGDALAVARQLSDLNYNCEVWLLDLGKKLTPCSARNWQRLRKQNKVQLSSIKKSNDFPSFDKSTVLIDGLFGSGLTRSLDGLASEVVQQLNQQKNTVVSIDMPSGLMGEDNSNNTMGSVIKADFTLSFQFPKISFLFSEHAEYTGDWEVLPIGLHARGIEQTATVYSMLEKKEMEHLLPQRSTFDHKGTFGHALLIAGSYGKMGAAILASRACLRAGVGLLTSHVPHMGYSIIQSAVPEAMASVDQHDSMFTEFPDLASFSAIGIGPGLDQKPNSCKALCSLLETAKVPLVLDADALNILSENKKWLDKLPQGSILTPHPGEFKRLVGSCNNSFQQIQKQIQFSKKFKVYLVLKGAYSTISTPEGEIYFNSTGNPGMATAGSGDVLTGIILGLLAQQIPSLDAAVLGVYLHGLAGDFAMQNKSEHALIAGDIVEEMGKAFLALKTDTI